MVLVVPVDQVSSISSCWHVVVEVPTAVIAQPYYYYYYYYYYYFYLPLAVAVAVAVVGGLQNCHAHACILQADRVS